MTYETTYSTVEECVQAERTKPHSLVHKYGTNIYRDRETGDYYANGAGSVTTFGIGRGWSETREPVLRVLPTGAIVPYEPKLKVGDRYFLGGTVYDVVSVGRDDFNHYDLHCVTRDGARMPSFKKQMREAGYTIVSDNPQKRQIVARKVIA